MPTNDRAPRWRGPLGSTGFRRLWMGEAVSVAGTQLHFVALPWLVLEATGSGAALGSGRVMSLVMLGAVGLTPVSYALAGALVAHGVAVPFLAAGALTIAAAALLWIPVRGMD